MYIKAKKKFYPMKKFHFFHKIRFFFLLFFIFLLSSFLQACSTFFATEEIVSNQGRPVLLEREDRQRERQRISLDDFALPQIPESLEESDFKPLFSFELLPYIVIFTSDDLQEAVDILRERSVLLSMQEDIPTDELVLEKRVLQDKNEAIKVLHSLGYYSAIVETKINKNTFPIQVEFNILSQNPYKIIKADIHYPEGFIENLPENNRINQENLRTSLFEFGLEKDEIAAAQSILDAIDSILPYFQNRGYPFAKVANTKFYAIEENHSFEAEIEFDPGPYKVFGDIEISGSDKLKKTYIEKLKQWQKGEPFNQRKLSDLEEKLLGIGVFSFARVHEEPENSENEDITIEIQLTDSPPRSWGGGFNYDSVRGFGGELFWEHRNILGSAEKLTLNAEVWQDLQEVRLDFKKPDLLSQDHNFNSIFTFKSEKTDAYDTTSARLEAGFEHSITIRRFQNIWLSYFALAEVGREETESLSGYQDYYYFGLPFHVNYRNTNSIFDPANGYSITLKAGPYAGKYRDNFSLFKAELEVTTYFELLKNKKLILAARGKIASLYPQDADSIPASLRFYAGGGDSVRGYAYQSLGPEDIHGDPIGGSSLVEASVELRYKVTETIAIVPFFDFGNVYSEAYPSYPLDLKFGAGLGLRYFTPVGPLRVDLAFPFEDGSGFELSKFQLYVSIGQSF